MLAWPPGLTGVGQCQSLLPDPLCSGRHASQRSLSLSCAAVSLLVEIWREHLEAYSRGALELEDSLEASTSQMMNLNL